MYRLENKKLLKKLILFVPGLFLSALLIMGSAIGIRAVFAQEPEPSNDTTQSLVELIPDINKIYREALTTPLNQVRSLIYDEEIADFYDTLLQRCDLFEP